MRFEGGVASLWRWPVKSLGGEGVPAARVDPGGVAGDRAYVLLETGGDGDRRLKPTRVPRMLAWSAAYPDAPGEALGPGEPPDAVVTSPAGASWRTGDPGLAAALADDLGHPLRLARGPGRQQDLPGTLLVTFEGSRRALEAAWGRPLDPRRFRANLHLDSDAPPFAEERWQTVRLDAGGVTFELVEPCDRCAVPTYHPETLERSPELLARLVRDHRQLFGIRVRPLGAGTLRVGGGATVSVA